LRIRFDSAARAELASAAKWYELQREGLGSDLIAEIEIALAAIAAQPTTWPRLSDHPELRRFVIARFPFSMVYLLRGDEEVVIVAVAHRARRPNYWRERRRRKR
jgi:hypothetical protein